MMRFMTFNLDGHITTRDLKRDDLARFAPMLLKIEVEMVHGERQDGAVWDAIRDGIEREVSDHYSGTFVVSNTDPELATFMNMGDDRAVHLIIVDRTDIGSLAEHIYQLAEREFLRYFMRRMKSEGWEDAVPKEHRVHPYRVTVRDVTRDESATFLRVAPNA